MSLFWKRKKQYDGREAHGSPGGAARQRRRRPVVALEVKLLAMEAREAGLTSHEVAPLVGVKSVTVDKWRRIYLREGEAGLRKKPASPKVRRQCTLLEERILQHRRDHPEQGVRRIRDQLRRDEGLAVSAETVRGVVNEAGLGNAPPQPKRRPVQVRRFERTYPNALWQIDIFTFQLKRMYQVYLVGMIDDHSRYMVGWGLYRRQTADAVLEVVKGAFGQWGAPRELLSDNGRQFVAWRGKSRFQRVLKQQGVQHVRSAPQHPQTLGKIERFWQTIWREYLSEATFASFADACQRIDHWMAYYNHQRPHQGIEGGCPADRFYGLSGDVEEAVKQGCAENAQRLALGQEPKPPLYLLGQLGGTDVRVTRQGDEIEVKVGEAVREVIRVGSAFAIDADGRGHRGMSDEVEGVERGGTLPGGGAGPEGRGGGGGAVPDLRCEPSDAVQGDGGVGPGIGGGVGTETRWAEETAGIGAAGTGAGKDDHHVTEGTGPLENKIRGGHGVPRAGAEAGAWGAAAGGAPGRKKTAETEEEVTSAPPWYGWELPEDGLEE